MSKPYDVVNTMLGDAVPSSAMATSFTHARLGGMPTTRGTNHSLTRPSLTDTSMPLRIKTRISLLASSGAGLKTSTSMIGSAKVTLLRQLPCVS
jgi:hypothetical protein